MGKNRKEDLRRVKPNHPRTKLRLVLDVPVSVNHMYINLRNGGKTLNAKAKAYLNNTKAKVMEYIEDSNYKVEDEYTWQYLDLVIYMPDKRIRDSHNLLKILMDSLEGVCFENDYSVLPRIQAVELDRENPRVEIMLQNQSKAERKRQLDRICNY